MATTLTTPAIYNGNFVIPEVKPDFAPEEVTVTFKARGAATSVPGEEWKKKLLALAGTLDISKHPEFDDPVAYVRKMRNMELEEMKQTYGDNPD